MIELLSHAYCYQYSIYNPQIKLVHSLSKACFTTSRVLSPKLCHFVLDGYVDKICFQYASLELRKNFKVYKLNLDLCPHHSYKQPLSSMPNELMPARLLGTLDTVQIPYVYNVLIRV